MFTFLSHLYWASNIDDKKSTNSYIIYLGCNLVCWKCSKQQIVAHFSTKAKDKVVVDVVDAIAELKWMCFLYTDLGVLMSSSPILWCYVLNN